MMDYEINNFYLNLSALKKTGKKNLSMNIFPLFAVKKKLHHAFYGICETKSNFFVVVVHLIIMEIKFTRNFLLEDKFTADCLEYIA